MWIASDSICQTSSDTICIPIAQVKKTINLIEKGKIVQQELDLTKTSLKLLERRIVLKDSIIAEYKVKDGLYKQMTDDYDALVFSSNEIADNLEKSLTLATRRYKRQSFMKWFGMAAAFGVGYFISK